MCIYILEIKERFHHNLYEWSVKHPPSSVILLQFTFSPSALHVWRQHQQQQPQCGGKNTKNSILNSTKFEMLPHISRE